MADPESGAVPVDPYETVLADLRAKRDDIERVIQTLESYRSGATVGAAPQARASSNSSASPSAGVMGPGAFLGMNIVDAAKALLASQRKTMANPEIAAALKAGGLAMNSREPANTVGSILTRRFEKVGDVVRVARGTWGLAEWYPNRSFKKRGATETVVAEVGGTVREPPVVGHPKGEPPPVDIFE